jgi:hypothetical protein
MIRGKRPKNFKDRLTISLAKKQRDGLTRIAKRRVRSVAFLVREAVDGYLMNGHAVKPD